MITRVRCCRSQSIRLRFAARLPIEPVVEDRPDRAIAQRADLQGAGGRGFKPLRPERLGQAQDAEAGAEALLGMRDAADA